MSATALLIKSMVRDHAETYPAGQDKGPRCQSLHAGLLRYFGHDRLEDFTVDEIPAVRRWLAQEAEPEAVRKLRDAKEKVLEARTGVDAYIRAVEELRKAAAPIMREAVRRWNPAGLPAHDAMGGLLSGPLLDSAQELRRGMETAEWTAIGLLNLARCLAHNRQGEEVDA